MTLWNGKINPYERGLVPGKGCRMPFVVVQSASPIWLNSQNVLARFATLTPRQQMITEAVVSGKTTKTIAYDIGISTRTVEKHRAIAMHKLGVRNLCGLLRIMITIEEKRRRLELTPSNDNA
jgi:DNA-binding NarL/FixJ family response regulator